VVARFDQTQASTDSGIVLLKAVDDRLHVTDKLAACPVDRWDPDKVRHTVQDLLLPTDLRPGLWLRGRQRRGPAGGRPAVQIGRGAGPWPRSRPSLDLRMQSGCGRWRGWDAN